jgi:hypothetical protein
MSRLSSWKDFAPSFTFCAVGQLQDLVEAAYKQASPEMEAALQNTVDATVIVDGAFDANGSGACRHCRSDDFKIRFCESSSAPSRRSEPDSEGGGGQKKQDPHLAGNLNLLNLLPLLARIPFLAEASIGHELTADALRDGFRPTVRRYAAALAAAGNGGG